MTNEEKIAILEQRISKLETIEKNRRTRNIIYITIKVVCFIVMLVIMFSLYLMIKPYFDDLNQIKDINNNLNLHDNIDLNEFLEQYFNY